MLEKNTASEDHRSHSEIAISIDWKVISFIEDAFSHLSHHIMHHTIRKSFNVSINFGLL